MNSWKLLDFVQVPAGGGELCLYQRGSEFLIEVDGTELMTSGMHGSEEALAELLCRRIAHVSNARVLIGGLGMGFTVSAALESLDATARIEIAEIVPEVVSWNRGPLSHLAGRPLDDERVHVHEADVAGLIATSEGAFDAILLDVDNGPDALTRPENDGLYSRRGLRAASSALRPGGALGIWSAGGSRTFTRRLRRTGFQVEEARARACGAKGGRKHTIWIATPRSRPETSSTPE